IGALHDGSKDNSDVAVHLGVAGNASRTPASILHVGVSAGHLWHRGQKMNVSHHTDPPEFRPLLGAPFPCTNQLRCVLGNTRARSSLWTRDSPNRHHIASARLQAGVIP